MGQTSSPARPLAPLFWRIAGGYLPALLLIVAAGSGAWLWLQQDGAPPLATVAADHAQLRDADIAFFETRVVETRDSLSYNRLTARYLQRLRETGDVADLGRAERSALRSLEVAKGAYSGLVYLASVRIAQHRFVEAAEVSRQAIGVDAKEPAAMAVLGDALMALGQYDAAAASYQMLLESAPGPEAFVRQASLAELRGDIEVARQFWEAAIDADAAQAPENAAWARVQLGNLLFTTGDLSGARDAFATALQVFPEYPSAQAGLGRVAAASGKYSDAIDWLEKATARIPAPEYVILLGDVLARSGDGGGAARQFALVDVIGRLLEENGVKDDLTLIIFRTDHGGVAPTLVEAAAAAYERRPSVAAADAYAWTLYRAGRLTEARAFAERALAQGTRDPALFFHAGVIAHALGDNASALRWLKAAHELNPQFSVLHAAELERRIDELGGGGK